ncbi:MAG: hypothetical protein ACKOAU_08045 [Pirellula sp.]
MVARFAVCAWFLLTVLLCLVAPPPGQVCAQGNPVGTNTPLNFYGDGFVLLQHGSVIRGFVKPQADSITVIMDKGKQVTLSKKQVLFIGSTIESLYKYQTRAIRKWGTGEHWHLAQWCIQNGMLDQAIEHYQELEKQAADNPKFKQLDLQLKQALMADEEVRRRMEEQGIELPNSPAQKNQLDPRTEIGGVLQASANVTKVTSDAETAVPIHTVPGYLRRSFQTEITPIVVSRCGQSGCHGMLTKNSFQVFQPVGEQAASINERNLLNTLRFVDADRPEESLLLHYAARPHGAQRNASFNLQREEDRLHLERIAKWIQSLDSMKPKSTVPTEAGTVVHAAGFSKPDTSAAVQHAIASPAKLSRPPKSGSAGVVINASELAEIEEEIRKLEKTAREKPKVVDPFDAKIFNSKYRSEGGRPVKSGQTPTP